MTDIEQRTLDWHRQRLGKITGSQVGNIFAKGRSKDDVFGKSALSYLNTVAAEQLIPQDVVDNDDDFSVYLDEVNVTSKAMRIGTEREAEARSLYAEVSSNQVEECGCIPHPEIAGFASSPDGLIPEGDKVEGTIEIKCPKPSTYMEYLSGVATPADLKVVNATYYWQCMSHIAVTGAQWCDFILYCPYNAKPMHVVRIERDEDAISQLYSRLGTAIIHIQKIINKALGAKG